MCEGQRRVRSLYPSYLAGGVTCLRTHCSCQQLARHSSWHPLCNWLACPPTSFHNGSAICATILSCPMHQNDPLVKQLDPFRAWGGEHRYLESHRTQAACYLKTLKQVFLLESSKVECQLIDCENILNNSVFSEFSLICAHPHLLVLHGTSPRSREGSTQRPGDSVSGNSQDLPSGLAVLQHLGGRLGAVNVLTMVPPHYMAQVSPEIVLVPRLVPHPQPPARVWLLTNIHIFFLFSVIPFLCRTWPDFQSIISPRPSCEPCQPAWSFPLQASI